jgi:hypothetical protein
VVPETGPIANARWQILAGQQAKMTKASVDCFGLQMAGRVHFWPDLCANKFRIRFGFLGFKMRICKCV